MPRHEDFQKIYQHFIDQYGEEEGEDNYYAWLNEHGYDDTKPMPKKESLSWLGKLKEAIDDLSWAGDLSKYPKENLFYGEAIHPVRTYHPNEWPKVREFLEEELVNFAPTLEGQPLVYDHLLEISKPYGIVASRWNPEISGVEYVGYGPDWIMKKIRDRKIQHVSIEYLWKLLQNVNGVAPRGMRGLGLGLLEHFRPGDPKTTALPVWEGIVKQLKEAKMSTAKEQAEPQEFILYLIRDPAAFLEERFSTAWLDLENGIQAIHGRLREEPENPQPMALLFMKAKGWTLEKMHGWLQDHSQYLRQSQPAAAAPAGIQSASPTPPIVQGVESMDKKELEKLVEAKVRAVLKEQQNQEPEKDEHGCIVGKERFDEESQTCVPIPQQQAQEQQGNEEPEKDEHGCVIGKERWDPEKNACVPVEEPQGLTATEQQGDQEPKKDEHGCIVGKEKWDPETQKCVPITTEQQGNQEPEKDEHGCLIGKEQWDPDQQKCVPIATEKKNKGLGEAILEPGAVEQLPLVVPVKKIEAKMPSLQAERSMGWGGQRFVQDIKGLIREAKEGSKSG
jgi:hypothetical protein